MGGVSSLGTRLQKLRAASFRELSHRLRYDVVLRAERRQWARASLARPARPHDVRAVIARQNDATNRWFPSLSNPNDTRAALRAHYAAECEDTARQALEARSHQFTFFGQTFQYGEEIAWQADPVSGHAWPPRYHADVPVHGGDVGFGDVKHVWELSRHQFLIDLGKDYWLTGNRSDLDAIERLVRSWRTANPYATGVNWACALEPAFRALSWLWAYHFTRRDIDDAFHAEWLDGFYDHGRFIARHLEHYSSPYNHLIGEAAALYSLGCCFPEFVESEGWRKLARQVLETRLDEQFYQDGGTAEQSTFYHHATVGFYLIAALVARANGEELSARVWTAIERGLEFSMWLTKPDGKVPAIGGADDGKPIRMEHLPFWDFRPYLAIGATLFNRGDFKAVAGRFHEDALWLLGTAGLAAFDEIEARAPVTTAVLLPKSGYASVRSDWSSLADYLVFDVGEQAAGMRPDAVPNSMHGHADCLSVVLSLNGRDVLVDSGLFAYNCGGTWEDHFRETAAHNTARVDGRDQARHIKKMAWSHSYRPAIEGHGGAPGQGWTIGSHDGFGRGPHGVTHRRAVWLREGYAIVFDEFTGSGAHQFEVNWQFAAGTLETMGPGHLVFDGFVDVVWLSDAHWTSASACGGAAPADGWVCPSLGIKTAAPRLSLTATLNLEPRLTLVTAFVVRTADRSRVHRETSDGRAMLGVIDDGWTDWIAASGVGTSNPIASDGLVTVCRVNGDRIEAQEHAGGSRVSSEHGTLLELTRARRSLAP